MVAMIVIQWTEKGIPLIVPGTGPPLLSDFLVTDVQDYWPRIREINQVMDRYGRGEAIEPVNFYGNVYQLKLGRETAVLTNMFASDIPPETILFTDFKAMFEIWVAALRSRER